ncbi:helix-turn-helix domain-containing protein [Streptomyces herbicida]|uniref:helix-turn-helix domain-containing protein n=1 Tax=Streptomyces herbicida TaxID=3065675 RepID=UPI00292D17AE|nr:helix-turn-helix domain-containing protein [Streptomyces sp. NEAU-HV9]
MSRIRWRRPLVLAVASMAIATGAACAAQASPGVTPGVSQVASADHSHCGQGGEGGKGGAPGEPGEPGKPGERGCFALGDLPDKPKSELTVVDKLRIVLIVESGQAKKSDVAKKYKISEKEIDTWVKQVRQGDWAALVNLNSLLGS